MRNLYIKKNIVEIQNSQSRKQVIHADLNLKLNKICNSQYRIPETEGSEQRRKLISVNVNFVRAVISLTGVYIVTKSLATKLPPKKPPGRVKCWIKNPLKDY